MHPRKTTRGADQEAQRDDLHPAQPAAALGVGGGSLGQRLSEAGPRRPAVGAAGDVPDGWVCVPLHHHPLSARADGAASTSPAASESAVLSEGIRERDTAIVAEQTPAGAVKTDGRKRRWHRHKVERRNELVDGTLEAIRRRGRNVSMDEIAAEIGVSKTVLYRYFVDKNDLTTAVMMRFAQTTLIPNMAAALSSNLDGFDLTREIIRVYVETVAAEPEIYPFVMANSSRKQEQSRRRLRANHRPDARRHAAPPDGTRSGMDTSGASRGRIMIVGGVQLATHSWMSHPRMSADELIDYLTMLSWSALCGIVEVGGSLEKFNVEEPHPSPILPPAC